MKRKILATVLALSMVFSLSACKGPAPAPAPTPAPAGAAAPAPEKTTTAESIVIKVFSNQTDRKTGQGLVEQTLFDNYIAENPNVKIEVEALDDEAYKTKFKAYASGSGMPDLVNSWGQPSFLSEVIDAGLLAELNPADYAADGFLNGSLDGFSKNDKLYGLPRNTDAMGFFYNKAIFDANGWKVPNSYEELLTLAGQIKEKGIIPCSMDGSDRWPLAIFYHDLAIRVGGDVKKQLSDSTSTGDFKEPFYTKAAELMQQAVQAGLFQTGFETADYGTALNLFANGQAAMFYMGSWEMSMASNQDVIPEVRDNIGVFTMPVVSGGKGIATDIMAWNGGGYSVSANSKNKEEAVKLLNYMFKPDGWSRIAWEEGVCMSAQDFSAYLSGKETSPQKAYVDILNNSTTISGTTINDLGTSNFKTVFEDAVQELAIGTKTPAQFIEAVSAGVQ